MINGEALNVADLMKPPSKNILNAVGRNFTKLKNNFGTLASLPATATAMARIAVESGKNTGEITVDDTVQSLIKSAELKPKNFRRIMKSNDQLFLHVIKEISLEDLKRFIDDGVFTQKELVLWAKKHIPWVAERGHWVRKHYGEEIIRKFIFENGNSKYKPDDKEYGFDYFIENGRRAWIEKNYRAEVADKKLEQYGDRVPDSVDFIEDIVSKVNEVITNNSPASVV